MDKINYKMAQSLRQQDEWMTQEAFSELTGINSKTSITQVKKLFKDIDMNEVFPTLLFHRVDPLDLECMRRALQLDGYIFLLKLFTIKHLLIDNDMIKLCKAVEKYSLYHQQSRLLQFRTGNYYTNTVEYVTSRTEHTLKYHNVSLCYARICDNETNNTIRVIHRLLAKRPFADMDELIAKNNAMIRRENTWQKRRGLAIFRDSIATFWKKPKTMERQSITFNEIVMLNKRYVRHLTQFI